MLGVPDMASPPLHTLGWPAFHQIPELVRLHDSIPTAGCIWPKNTSDPQRTTSKKSLTHPKKAVGQVALSKRCIMFSILQWPFGGLITVDNHFQTNPYHMVGFYIPFRPTSPFLPQIYIFIALDPWFCLVQYL